MDMKEAAARLGVSIKQISKLLHQGRLVGKQAGAPGSRGVWNIDVDSVEAYAGTYHKRGPKPTAKPAPRPPGRPRKEPIADDLPKRPRGRPRKQAS